VADSQGISPPRRELIAAFSEAAKVGLTAAGWRKYAGDIYTLGLDDDYAGWLGLNKATTYTPIKIHPVAGLVHRPTMALVNRLTGYRNPTPVPTLSSPISSGLGRREGVGDLSVGTIEQAYRAAEELVRLATVYALPFVTALANPEAMVSALRSREYVVVGDYAIERLPAFLYVTGRPLEAIEALREAIASLAGRSDPAAENHRRFQERFEAFVNGAAT
jgi:hypothetical protein